MKSIWYFDPSIKQFQRWQKEGKRKAQNQKEDIIGNHKYEYG